MLKVFLVEDESIVRESLRDNIPWNEYGYEFVGEAGDGEMALPLIRKTQPDLLITDIRMPFMDGLSLTHIVKKELPQIRVIVISGFDDFEYARRALTEGVDQYIMKPITRNTMWQALTMIRDKIEDEKKQQGYLEQYRLERREFEQMQRREFMEKVFSGTMPVEHIYEEAGKLGIAVDAACYNLILFSLRDADDSSDACDSAQNELMLYFMRSPAYFPMEWNLSSYCILVRGSEEAVREFAEQGMRKIEEVCRKAGDRLIWYAAKGEPVLRFSALQECFEKANHAFACRYWKPEEHILTDETAGKILPENDRSTIRSVDASQVDPEVVIRFLKDGDPTGIPDFVSNYLDSLGDVLNSRIFRGYLVLNVRFSVLRWLQDAGIAQEKAQESLDADSQNFYLEAGEVAGYLKNLLAGAMELAGNASASKNRSLAEAAKDYLDAHYAEESLSLNSVAQTLGVSAGYLSAAFSKEQGETFVEYLTGRRMALARELLAQGMHTAEAAARTGYRDPHYFSFVFRKTQGMSTREFRQRAQRAQEAQ